MLRTLTIRDFILVDQAELEFGAGFSVLSGETGAGKSILLDALALVLGGRGETIVIRNGADRAEIAAAFDLTAQPILRTWLADNDLAGDGDECLLRRVIDTQGRSRAYVNGRQATLAQLREIGEVLVDLYGQHQHQSLLRLDAQRQLLDAFGGLSDLSRRVAAAWRTWRDLLARQGEAARASAQLAAERDLLMQRREDLSALNLGADEWQQLSIEQSRLAHAAGLIETASYGVQALADAEDSCEAQLRAVVSRLASMAQYDPALAETTALLESAQIQLQEAAHALRQYQQRLDLDPAELEAVEGRLSAIHELARKYRVRPEELTALRDATDARLAELATTLDTEALAREEAAARDAYATLATELRDGVATVTPRDSGTPCRTCG